MVSRQNTNIVLIIKSWYPSVKHECKNTIENVGLFELSPFSKYEIKGTKSL
jgi:4-methylaminobutanoate oxidase (formaldehyde-forming)